jgi:hypothetical protein
VAKEDYPTLPLLLSLLDTAIDHKQPFGSNWPPDELVRVREAMEYAIAPPTADTNLRRTL